MGLSRIKSSAAGAAEGRLNSPEVFSPMKYYKISNLRFVTELQSGLSVKVVIAPIACIIGKHASKFGRIRHIFNKIAIL